MREQHVIEMIDNLYIDGYSEEVPLSVLQQKLTKYVGYDKYKLRYTLEVLVDVGCFSWIGLRTLKIHGLNGMAVINHDGIKK